MKITDLENKIINADCIEILKWKKKKVQLILG